MRAPVKEPGPTSTATASNSRNSRPPARNTSSTMPGAKRECWLAASSLRMVTLPRAYNAAEHASVTVSNARMFKLVARITVTIAVTVAEVTVASITVTKLVTVTVTNNITVTAPAFVTPAVF